jgi:hypothetical protein
MKPRRLRSFNLEVAAQVTSRMNALIHLISLSTSFEEGGKKINLPVSLSEGHWPSNKVHLERLEDFLVASTFLFCDWIDFVS